MVFDGSRYGLSTGEAVMKIEVFAKSVAREAAAALALLALLPLGVAAQ